MQILDWEVKTAALIDETAQLKDMIKAVKAKYKERMLAVGGQNKVLRWVADFWSFSFTWLSEMHAMYKERMLALGGQSEVLRCVCWSTAVKQRASVRRAWPQT